MHYVELPIKIQLNGELVAYRTGLGREAAGLYPATVYILSKSPTRG